MRSVLIMLVPLFTVACATGETALTTSAAPSPEKPDTGKWKFERYTDPITRAPAVTAWLEISGFNFVSGTSFAQLQLMCFKDAPVVRLRFNRKIGSDKNAAIAYRFDDNPGRDAKARFLARERAIVIENKTEIAQFSEELSKAERLYVRVSNLARGEIIAKFAVQGGAYAIEQAFAACPLPDDKIKKRVGV